jgi:hypothetical protein
MSSSLAAIILSVKPSFSLKPKPKPKPLICRFNLLSFKIKTNPHSGLQLGPRMSVAFCLSPSEAAAHIVVQDDLDAFLRVLHSYLRAQLSFLCFFFFFFFFGTKVLSNCLGLSTATFLQLAMKAFLFYNWQAPY